MNTGFVLVFWTLVAFGFAVCVATGLYIRARDSDGATVLQAAKAAALPFTILAWSGTAFVGYSAWCAARHVDIGIGDVWEVPIAGGYSFCMGDVPDRSALTRSNCSGNQVVGDITDLALVGEAAVGKRSSGAVFVLSTSSGRVREFARIEDAVSEFPQRLVLQSANGFYTRQRWGWPDVFFVSVVVSGAAGLIYVWKRRYLGRARTADGRPRFS